MLKLSFLIVNIIVSVNLFAQSIPYLYSDGSSVQYSLDLWNGGNFNDNTPPKVVNDPITYLNNSGNKVIQAVSYFGLWDKGGSKTGVHCQLVKNKKTDNTFLFTLGNTRTIEFSFLIPSSTNPAAINYTVVDPNDGITYSVQDNGGIRAIHQLIQNYSASNWCPTIMFIAEPSRKKLYLRNVTMPFVGDMTQLTGFDPKLEERDFELMSFEFDTWYTIRFQIILENGTNGRSKVFSVENGLVKQLPFKQVSRNDHSIEITELVNGVSQQLVRYELQGTTLFSEYFNIATHQKVQIANPTTNFSTENYAWFSSTLPAPNKRAAVTYHDNIKIYEETPSFNLAPTNIILSATTINENLATGSTIGTFSTTDPNAGNTFTYTLATGGTDNASFTIAGNTIKTNALFNFEVKSSYSIKIRTIDQDGFYYDKTFTITVNNVTEAPINITISASSVAENKPIGTVIGTLTSTDPDSGNTFTYTLAAGGTDNSKFTILDNQLKTNAVFDYPTKNSYSIKIRTTDQGGLFFEKTFTLTVLNVNETPTNITISETAVNENQSVGTVVGTLTSTDPDAGNIFTYTLATGGTDNLKFTILDNQLKTNAVFDYPTKNLYSIKIRTTDQGGLFFEKTFTLTVLNVNETPTNIIISATSVNENQNVGTVVGTLTSADPDAGNIFTYTLAAGGTDNLKFTILDNQLKTNAVFDYPTKNSYSIKIRTTDQGGLFFEKTFIITIKRSDLWLFDADIDGWNFPQRLTTNVAGGIANLTITGADPYIFSPENINISASTYKYLVVRLQNKTSDNTAQIFWTTIIDATWSDLKSVKINMVPNDSIQRDYIIDLTDITAWSGTIKQIRYDPAGSAISGLVAVDLIKFVGMYPNTAYSIPGTIEAENFNVGGQDNAYSDAESTNKGGQYRLTEAVDISVHPQQAGNYVISWTTSGEWLEYLINVTQQGNYDVEFIASSLSGGGEISLSLGSTAITNVITVPSTGSWAIYEPITESISLTKGIKVLRLNVVKGGFNFDKMVVKPSVITGNEFYFENDEITVYPNPNNRGIFNLSKSGDWQIYNTLGHQILLGSGSLIDLANQPKGMYLLKTKNSLLKLKFE